jgi:hypothetical protein
VYLEATSRIIYIYLFFINNVYATQDYVMKLKTKKIYGQRGVIYYIRKWSLYKYRDALTT